MMRQCTQTFHTLEMRHTPNGSWVKPSEAMYRPAELFAYQGRLVEAIEEAERMRLLRRGEMHGISFRCVTTTKTITVAAGPREDAQFDS